MKLKKGFTLIELLVVISIIGLLASVVLSNLNTARSRAKDAAVRSGVKEMQKLLLLEYQENGSYVALQGNWWFTAGTSCNAVFNGNYAAEARKICQNIVDNAGMWNSNPSYRMHIGNASNLNQDYSIMGFLSNGHMFCLGSGGQTDDSNYSVSGWGDKGCYGNP